MSNRRRNTGANIEFAVGYSAGGGCAHLMAAMPTMWAGAGEGRGSQPLIFRTFNPAQVMLIESIAMVENDACSRVLNMNLRCE
ncbi:MAG: hypothetical protein C4576_11760 [Desulfobacteraceae bacterium]|nr:MAG: hypothetical protein C4576_11760 [Desulfobacteraceae bacterium]